MNSLPPEQRTMTTNDGTGTKIEPIPGMGVCDFCTETPVRWEYPCGLVAVVTEVGTHASNDSWGACDECHDLIEAGDTDGLAERAAVSLVATHGELPPEALTMLRELQAGFFDARLGDARHV